MKLELYVDDLVTTDKERSKGYGKEMIKFFEAEARSNGAEYLILDSGMQRKDAHRFYLREGFEICGFHFQKPIELDDVHLVRTALENKDDTCLGASLTPSIIIVTTILAAFVAGYSLGRSK